MLLCGATLLEEAAGEAARLGMQLLSGCLQLCLALAPSALWLQGLDA